MLLRQPISPTGPTVSPLIAGFWRLKHWEVTPQVLLRYLEQLVELGVTTVDHALVYRSEAPFGAALALRPQLRQQLELVTKCGIRVPGFGEHGAERIVHYDSSAAAIITSVESSLRDLGTDHIDILLLHRPDYLLDVHEVAEAFTRLKTQGKVRHFGVSNFSAAQFRNLQKVWSDGLVTNQIEFSPLAMQALDSGVLEACVMEGVRPMFWSCLGGGRLLAGEDAQSQRILAALQQVREEVGAATLEQVVYAWVLALPCRPLPILGTSKIERVVQAVDAVRLRLSREQWYSIWEAANGAPVP